MDEMYAGLADFLKRPEVVETLIDIVLCAVPIWVAVMIGLVIGWSWRPRWTGLVFLGLRSRFRFFWTLPPGFGARRLWLAFTALSAFSVCRKLWSSFMVKVPEPPAGEERPVEGDGAGFLSFLDLHGPCRFIAPIFAELAKKFTNAIFLKVDTDELVTVSQEWKVHAMPTFIFLEDGEVLDRVVGANKEELQKKVGLLLNPQ